MVYRLSQWRVQPRIGQGWTETASPLGNPPLLHPTGPERGVAWGRSLLLLGIILIVGYPGVPAIAQGVPARSVDALAHPRASQRFFAAGVAQLERQIDWLLHQSQASPAKLSIEEDLVRSQEQFRLQQEHGLENRLRPKPR